MNQAMTRLSSFGSRPISRTKTRRRMLLAPLFLGFWSPLLWGSDCSKQNIFFPLGDGFSWNYLCRAVDEDGIQTFSSRIVCTLNSVDPDPPIGRLTEVWSGLKAAVTIATPVKVVEGAVYTIEPTMRIHAPEIQMTGMIADKAAVYQIYLPAMHSLAVGAGWSRSGGFVIVANAPKVTRSIEGVYRQSDSAVVLGLENLSVKAGSFSALKVQAQLSVQVAGGSGGPQLSTLWFVPGIGLVKEEAQDGSFSRELTSFDVTPCCGYVVSSAGAGVRVNGQPASQGMGVSGQALVSVPQGSSLDLASGDGSRIRVRGGTEASLDAFCDKRSQTPNKSVVKLLKGLLLNNVSKIFSGASRFEIHTASCIIGSRSTEFSVEVRESGGRSQTTVEVMSGEVWVRKTSDNAEIILHAGSRQTFE